MNTQQTQKEVLVNEIISILSKEDVRGKIEVLANVFLRLGVSYTDIELENINHKTIYEQILRDIKNNGDTLGNSLVRQGLVILDWLNEGK
tara:strand:- start:2342 stop:2611 length:270 start_codon:yes stop_codon:yes gene_type:complete